MKKTRERSLTILADAAFQQAAKKVIERAEKSGTPVIIWEDGAPKATDPRKARRRRGATERDNTRPLG